MVSRTLLKKKPAAGKDALRKNMHAHTKNKITKPTSNTKSFQRHGKESSNNTKSFQKRNGKESTNNTKSFQRNGKESSNNTKSFQRNGKESTKTTTSSETPKKPPHHRMKYGKKHQDNKQGEEESDFEEVPLEVDAFHDSDEDSDNDVTQPSSSLELEEELDFEAAGKEMMLQVQAANRKGTKSGGFESMGLSQPIFKAIKHKGYRVPTPIQRKSIPVIIQGRDVVAMARTGSGKTAAFVIPLIEKLKMHSAQVGARGIILSPSRELALQTLKFVKELAKYTDIRACMLVGGENMEEQFNLMAGNPDIIIATPGRFMHLIVEMNLNLKTVEYIVFDEADRLFELGFAEHLREILFKLPASRQTLLFSATLPKNLVDFARAGLSEPALIRLDVDTKISKDLELMFFHIKTEDKDAALLFTLRHIVKITEKEPLTIIFAPTRHHVDYLHELLTEAGFESTYIYGALDQTARKIHLAQFRAGSVKILIVTDVAARGIDIPLLDYVINYEFPGAPKIFVHRVGRAARAGRRGTAISLVTSDEMPYLMDLQLFLGRPLLLGAAFESNTTHAAAYTSEVVLGTLPSAMLDQDREAVDGALKKNITLQTMLDAAKNGFKLYIKTRSSASQESYTRSKEVLNSSIGMHPVAAELGGQVEKVRQDLLRSISQFRPCETVFEVGKRGAKGKEAAIMLKRRHDLHHVILANKETRESSRQDMLEKQRGILKSTLSDNGKEQDFQGFDLSNDTRKRKQTGTYLFYFSSLDFKDSDYYMSHYKRDEATERGYTVHTKPTTFAEQVKSATMDLTGDDSNSMLKNKSAKLLWDSKKHKFIRPTVGSDNKKMIKTESGALIAGSYKSDRFREWRKRTKIDIPMSGEQELPNAAALSSSFKRFKHTKVTEANPNSTNSKRKAAKMEKMAKSEPKEESDMVKIRKGGKSKLVKHKTEGMRAKSELKSTSQIAKERKQKEQRRAKTGRHKPKPKRKGR